MLLRNVLTAPYRRRAEITKLLERFLMAKQT